MTIRGGGVLTLSETVERAGVSEEKFLRIMRAAGFPEPVPGDRVLSEQIAGLAAGMEAAEEVFGEDAVLQLVRVMGSAMARLADAVVSAFWSTSSPACETRIPSGWAWPAPTPKRPRCCRP